MATTLPFPVKKVDLTSLAHWTQDSGLPLEDEPLQLLGRVPPRVQGGGAWRNGQDKQEAATHACAEPLHVPECLVGTSLPAVRLTRFLPPFLALLALLRSIRPRTVRWPSPRKSHNGIRSATVDLPRPICTSRPSGVFVGHGPTFGRAHNQPANSSEGPILTFCRRISSGQRKEAIPYGVRSSNWNIKQPSRNVSRNTRLTRLRMDCLHRKSPFYDCFYRCPPVSSEANDFGHHRRQRRNYVALGQLRGHRVFKSTACSIPVCAYRSEYDRAAMLRANLRLSI